MRTVFNRTEPAPPPVREVPRQAALTAIRKALLLLSDGEHSVCEIAAEKGIFCHGFKRYTDNQLRQRYAWLVRHDPSITREKLEEIADRWQIARQMVNDMPLACDVQRVEHDTCGGWDDFSDQDLARFYEELVGEKVVVVP
jgi:hypothetical protein